MDTLLTEIISFSGTAKGIPAYAAGTQLYLYFSMLRKRLPRILADDRGSGLAANQRETGESE